MKQVRTGIFETNSSSSHSLVISKKSRGYNFNLPVNQRGKLRIKFGGYGWGPKVLYTPYEKLCYWMTDHASEFWYDFKGKTFEENLQTFEGKPVIKGAIKTIKKFCKDVKTIEFEYFDPYDEFGYIDHDSIGTANGTDLKEVVFNNDCIIIIDNDNYMHFAPWDEDCDDYVTTHRDPEELFDYDMNKSTWECDYDDNDEIIFKKLNLVKRDDTEENGVI